MAASTEMAEEIFRVLKAPYPIGLQSLHHLLQTDIEGHALRRFCDTNPCVAAGLAVRMGEELESRPHVALSILTILSTFN
jgi:hypothetical protein